MSLDPYQEGETADMTERLPERSVFQTAPPSSVNYLNDLNDNPIVDVSDLGKDDREKNLAGKYSYFKRIIPRDIKQDTQTRKKIKTQAKTTLKQMKKPMNLEDRAKLDRLSNDPREEFRHMYTNRVQSEVRNPINIFSHPMLTGLPMHLL
jgi:hypothetical protein